MAFKTEQFAAIFRKAISLLEKIGLEGYEIRQELITFRKKLEEFGKKDIEHGVSNARIFLSYNIKEKITEEQKKLLEEILEKEIIAGVEKQRASFPIRQRKTPEEKLFNAIDIVCKEMEEPLYVELEPGYLTQANATEAIIHNIHAIEI